MQYFDLLPDEILKKIFSYVFEFTHCNLVCKRFNKTINDMIKGLNKDPVFDFMPDKVHKICNQSNIDIVHLCEHCKYNFSLINDKLYEKYKDCVSNNDLLQINYIFCKLRLFYDLCIYENPNVFFNIIDRITHKEIMCYFHDLDYGLFLSKVVLINKWNNLAKKYIKNKKSVVNFICVTNKIRELLYIKP